MENEIGVLVHAFVKPSVGWEGKTSGVERKKGTGPCDFTSGDTRNETYPTRKPVTRDSDAVQISPAHNDRCDKST